MLFSSLFTKSPVNFLSIKSNFTMSSKGKKYLFYMLKLVNLGFKLIVKLLLMLKKFTGLLVKSELNSIILC